MEILLTLISGGVVGTILTFWIQRRKENRVDQQTINNSLFEQIGRLTEKLERLEKENDEKDLIILEEKEKNYKKDVLIEQLERKLEEMNKKYEELKQDYEEIKLLLIKKEGKK